MKKFLLTMSILGALSFSGDLVFAAPAPIITSITPSTGTSAGGTSVTVSGMHLDGVTLTIGGNPATTIVVATSSQSLTAITPAGVVGAQDVVVANSDGTSTLAGGFTYTSSAAACNGSTFDGFNNGSVNGQSGWHVSGDIDQEIVSNTFGYPTFGCKSLRMSDATTSVFIFNQVFSNSTSNAGEASALDDNGATGTPRNRFEAQFDIAPVTSNEQPGLHMSVSPDRGDGTRMSSVGFSDTAGGIDVFFDDVTGTTSPVTFNETQIATGLSRLTPHTIKFLMDFVEGASNDVVQIFIDGNLAHTGTSWENFYRYDADAFGGPNASSSRTVNSLVFYEPNPAVPANKFNGFLIDNLSLSATTTATSTATTTDTTAPVITLNGSSTMNIFQNTAFVDPGATATDNVDGTVAVTATGTVNTAIIGGYTITYTATDSSNNVATTTRTVHVVTTANASSTPPIITLNGSSTINIFVNSTFTDPGATANDAQDGNVTVTATGTVDTTLVGGYTIVYTAVDSDNNTASTTRAVNVISTSTLPTITLNGSSTIGITQNTVFTDPGATAVDATGQTLSVTATGTVNTGVLGSYPIVYSAIDINGNNATTTRTVHVVAAPVSGGGGGGSSGGGYFIFSPLPGFSSIPSNNPSTGGSPINVSLVSTPTGEVLGVAVYNFKRNMKIGATGDDVQELQRYLISQGYLVLKNPTKYFGNMTAKALAKWQKAHGLPSTGYFGPMSRSEIIK